MPFLSFAYLLPFSLTTKKKENKIVTVLHDCGTMTIFDTLHCAYHSAFRDALLRSGYRVVEQIDA